MQPSGQPKALLTTAFRAFLQGMRRKVTILPLYETSTRP